MTFKPEKKVKQPRGQFAVRFNEEDREIVRRAAAASDMTSTHFIRQCVFYAIDNMEAKSRGAS